jgi:hypothetical protein
MKKLTIATLLLAGITFNSAASTFLFDPEQDGTFFPVDLMNTQLLPNSPVDVHQYLGADGKLNDGDKFTESFVYNFTNATSPALTTEIWGIGELNLSVSLSGSISNVVYGAGVPDIADPAAVFAANLQATSFDTDFNTSAADSTVSLTFDYMGTVIGEFDVTASTVTEAIALDGGNTNVGFIFNYEFDAVWAAANTGLINDVWRTITDDDIDLDLFKLQSTGSAGPNGTSDGVFADALGVYVDINTKDNGSTITASIPEPTSIAMLGLGLLGLAGSRRKKSK